MTFSMEEIINIFILVMLFVMIIYCIVLNRRLKAFRNIKDEMAELIGQLNASTTHAQKAIVELKNTVFQEEKKLSEKLSKAAEMADELDMINQTGSNLADRIEKGLVTNRKATGEEIFGGQQSTDLSKKSLSDMELTEGNLKDSDILRENLRNVR